MHFTVVAKANARCGGEDPFLAELKNSSNTPSSANTIVLPGKVEPQ
jgi:hypothetical protein